MKEKILQELVRIESEHDVRVLFACESGSRAWGFASQDSDWDVRFIYVHTRNWYLSVEHQRDVIEEMLPGDLDVSGWDIRKALGLLRKSNPSLLEWIRSPIVYRADQAFLDAIRQIAAEHASLDRLFQHYLSMARSNLRTYLQGESVIRKKYLYALRPTLACLWIEREGSLPPIEFEPLTSAASLPAPLLKTIEALLLEKRIGTELGEGPKIPVLSDFIKDELERLGAVQFKAQESPPLTPFDNFFRSLL